MLDGEVVAAIIAEVRRQLEIYGVAPGDLRVSRSSQPTAQHSGAAPGSAKFQVFIEPVANTEIGWRREYSEPSPGDYDLTVQHVKQKSYQISCLTDFDPSVPTDIPAQDLAHIVNDMIKHPDSVRALKDGGVNILSSGPVRPSFRLNESDEYESMPNFDIVVNYNAEYTKPVPVITSADGDVYHV